MSSLRRDASVNAIGNIVLAVLGVASGSLISYRFGAEGRGLLGAAQVVGALSAGIGSLGLGDALLYRIASGGHLDRRGMIAASIVGAAGGALLGGAVGWVVSRRLDVSGDERAFVLFCTVVAGTTAFFLVPSGALRGFGSFLAWNVLRVVAAAAWVGALLVGGLHDRISLPVIALFYGASLVAVGLVATFCVRRRVRGTAAALSPPRSMRALFAFGIPSAFASAPLLLNARIDQVALALGSSASTVGQYVAAAGYCWATVPLGQAIANLTATRVAGQLDDCSRVAALQRLSRVGVTVVGLSGAVAWLAAPVALRLLNGPGFGEAVPIARVLLVGATLQGTTYLLEEGARGLGRPKLAMLAEVSGLVTMVVLLTILARHGAIPTALASTAGYVVSFVVIVRGVCRVGKITPWGLLRPAGPQMVRSLGTPPLEPPKALSSRP